MSFSFRKIHSAISAAYHFTFSDPYLYNLISELDSFTSNDLIKIFLIDGVSHLTEHNFDDVLSKINYCENKKVSDFCNIIKDIIFPQKPITSNHVNNMFDFHTNSILNEYISIFKSSSMTNYYIIGYFYENYLEKYNKIIDKLKYINNQINDIENNNREYNELITLKQLKFEIYMALIKDFIIELSSKFYDDFCLKIVKNVFNMPDEFNNLNRFPFKEMCDALNNSKKLLDAHNENIKTLF